MKRQTDQAESLNSILKTLEQMLPASDEPQPSSQEVLQRAIEHAGHEVVFECEVRPFTLALAPDGRVHVYLERGTGLEDFEITLEEALRLYSFGTHYSNDSAPGAAHARFLEIIAERVRVAAPAPSAPATTEERSSGRAAQQKGGAA